MKTFLAVIFLGLLMLLQSCRGEIEMTESEKNETINSAKRTVQKVFDHSNNLDFLKGLDLYSSSADSYYINNGTILSLKELKESYREIGTSIELLSNSIDSWKSVVLSRNTVVFTLPVHLRIKLKGMPEYKGQLVWSGIVHKANGKWEIIQSHESWVDPVGAASALNPAENDKR